MSENIFGPFCFQDTRKSPGNRLSFMYAVGTFTRFLLMLAILATDALCQTPAFEVASVKPHPWPGGNGTLGVTVRGNTLYAEHVGLSDLIEYAWDLKEGQLSGGPSWATRAGKLVDSELFQVTAKAGGSDGDAPPPASEFRLMLQALLADRFHLQVHHVQKEMPVYNLVLAKGGPKLKESLPDAEAVASMSPLGRNGIRLVAVKTTIPFLVDSVLYHAAGRPVFDKTGLGGYYDFTLEWVPTSASAEVDASTMEGQFLFTAIQSQLGLKLEPGMAEFDTIVIDHAERPTAN